MIFVISVVVIVVFVIFVVIILSLADELHGRLPLKMLFGIFT